MSKMDITVHISPRELSEIITNSDNTLILDCRPFLSFNEGHIITARNVHCPPILKRRSGGFISLENIVPDETKRLHLTSGHYTSVVLYDHDTNTLADASHDTNLYLVFKSLNQQIQNVDIFYLSGGYATFKTIFPRLCIAERVLLDSYLDKPSTSYLVHPVEILPHVFLGDHCHARNIDLLKKLGMTAVINVSSSCSNYFPNDFRYLTIPVEDSQYADLSSWFQQAITFIDQEKSVGGRVLVHCHAGVSRSATVCLAYLMQYDGLGLDSAFEYVQSRRSVISPNLNFMKQLQDFEKELSESSPPKDPYLKSPCRIEAPFTFCFPEFCPSLTHKHNSPLASPT
ncbi:dual specificity protein phosphatase 4-like [Argonauta hians]